MKIVLLNINIWIFNENVLFESPWHSFCEWTIRILHDIWRLVKHERGTPIHLIRTGEGEKNKDTNKNDNDI